jgi:hypothetical protein
MGKIVSRLSMAALGIVITVALLAGALTTAALADDNTIEMVVSPNTLNLGSEGGVIRIHADIDYDSVADVVVKVEGTSIDVLNTFADSRGDLVIKCNLEFVKTVVEVEDADTATFVATIPANGDVYSGEDTIPVISCPE